MEREPWRYIWGTLFLGDINMGTWPYRLGETKDSDPSGTALARTSSNSKLQTRPLFREDAATV
jgi:hypothetical protein